MSKRFGRNQKRKAREQTDELRAIADELGGLAVQQERRAERAEARVRQLGEELRRRNENTIYLETRVDRFLEDLTLGVSASAEAGEVYMAKAVKLTEHDVREAMRADLPKVVRSIAEGLAQALVYGGDGPSTFRR